jgi:hypothetical protein
VKSFNRNILIGIAVGIIIASTLIILGFMNPTAQTAEHADVTSPKNPDFASQHCIVTGFATDNLSEGALGNLDCNIKAWLNEKGNALQYRIEITGMQLVDTDNNAQDDVSQLHIHKNTMGTTEDPKGPHQLNVFKAPNFDDFDVVIQPVQGVITGTWTDEDENTSYGEPDNSHKLTENLQLLCDGKIFAAAHGTAEDAPGHKAPYLKMLLEPTSDGQKTCKRIEQNNPNTKDSVMDMMERGDIAMGFNQTKIMHHFVATTTGGEIRILALDGSDTKTISEIRTHVNNIQYEFSQGNFTKPFFIHTQVVPGTQVMTEKKDLIQYSTRQIEGGAILVLTTNDAELLDAIKQFMDFQSSQHMGH